MRNVSWIASLLGVILLAIYGLALAFLGGDAKLGAEGAAAVAVAVPVWAHFVGGVGGALTIGGFWGLVSDLRRGGADQTLGRVWTAVFAVALVLVMAVVVNMIAQRHDTRWDVTRTQRHTLAPQSVEIARKLDREVQVVAFFPTGSPEEQAFKTLLENYQGETTLLRAEFHDPYGDAVLSEQMKITSAAGTVVLRAEDAEQRLEYDFSEQAFTNALVKVTAGRTHTVCGVTGHGEADGLDEQTPDGLGLAVSKLQGQNYGYKAVNLLNDALTPEACEVVLLAGPRAELAPVERDRLAQYVAAGGGLVAMLDPIDAPETAADFSRYGVDVGADVVIEADPMRRVPNGDPTFVLLDASSVDPHPLTAKLQGAMLFQTARTVTKGAAAEGLEVKPLLHASTSSWGETSLTDGRVEAEPTEGEDRIGSVPLAQAVEVRDPASIRTTTTASAPTPAEGAPAVTLAEGASPKAAAETPVPKAGGKVVVFGDADFVGNQALLAGVNQDLFLNAVAWMVGEDAQLSIRSNDAGAGKLDLDGLALFFAGILSLLVVPGLTVAGAIGTWVMRRRM